MLVVSSHWVSISIKKKVREALLLLSRSSLLTISTIFSSNFNLYNLSYIHGYQHPKNGKWRVLELRKTRSLRCFLSGWPTMQKMFKGFGCVEASQEGRAE
ncbi:hypothetical protein Scep_010089 [Stephania cephalantha]|uniref:Uncharacterized protein n=1 Tax=Stephania cephalantha TaxID=152367 RepID=A0AAP0PD16_9MAGN